MKASNFIIDHVGNDGKYYLFSTLNGSVVSVDQSKKDRLISIINNNSTECCAAVETLKDMGFIIDDQVDEFQLATGRKIIKDINSNYLELIILPTEKCNFRCVYCYENFEKPKMSREIQDAVIEFVKRELPSHKGLAVSWFGGEPLLAMDAIEYLSKAFIDICKKMKKPYRSSITTNGYLLNRDLFERLYDLRVLHYQITIDGDSSIHDRQRILIGGAPTFERIMSNLIDIRDNAKGKLWTISVRTNVTMNIVDNIDKFKKEVLDPLSDDSRFYVMLRQMWTNNTEEADAIVCNNQIFDKFVSDCNVNYRSLYQEYVFSYNSNFSCYASNPNSFVIGSDGCIYKCTCGLYDEKNKVGKINIDGSAFMDNDKLSYWVAPRVSNQKECMSCANYAACVSKGCPYKQNITCDKETLSVLKCYIPQFFHIADKRADLTSLI